MNLSQPIKGTPVASNGVRPLTERELDFYKTMEVHYTARCLADPCNMLLRAQLKAYKHIVESKEVGTFVGGIPISD